MLDKVGKFPIDLKLPKNSGVLRLMTRGDTPQKQKKWRSKNGGEKKQCR